MNGNRHSKKCRLDEVNSQVERELREQPEALGRLLERGRSAALEIAGAIRAASPQFVMIAARGSSDNAACYAQYVLGLRQRLAVGLAVPSLFTRYGTPPSLAGSLVIGISQSGQSPDIVSVVSEGRRQGAVTVAITNDEASPLASAAAHAFPLHAGEERAVAATKTYLNELLAIAMLSAALDDDQGASVWAELAALPALVAETFRLNESLESVAMRFRSTERFVVVGRGLNYATAREIALKMKELAYVMAEPYSTADLFHGPIAMVDDRMPVMFVAPSVHATEDLDRLLDIARTRQTPLIAISDRDEILSTATEAFRLPSCASEWLSPIVAVVPGQLWALALANARGIQPDTPRGLSKITQTW